MSYFYRTSPYVHKYARDPPESLVRALKWEVERYDAICDEVEAKLSQALAGIRYKIIWERQRIASSEARSIQNPPPLSDQDSANILDATQSISPLIPTQPQMPQMPPGFQPGMGLAGRGARRPPTVSLSSLRGSKAGVVSMRLDIPPSTLLLDESIPGLFSPVTLAPKTARPPQSAVDDDTHFFNENTAATLGDSESVPGLDHMSVDLGAERPTRTALLESPTPMLELVDPGEMESLFGDVGPIETDMPMVQDTTNLAMPEPDDSNSLFQSDHDGLVDLTIAESLNQVSNIGPSIEMEASHSESRPPNDENVLMSSLPKDGGSAGQMAGSELEPDFGINFDVFSPNIFGQLSGADIGGNSLDKGLDLGELMQDSNGQGNA